MFASNSPTCPTTTAFEPIYLPPRVFVVKPENFVEVFTMIRKEKSPQGAAVMFDIDDTTFDFLPTKIDNPKASTTGKRWAKIKSFFSKKTTPSSVFQTPVIHDAAITATPNTVSTVSTAITSTSIGTSTSAAFTPDAPKTTHVAGADPFRASIVHHLTVDEQHGGTWLGLSHQLAKELDAFAAKYFAVEEAQSIAEELDATSPASALLRVDDKLHVAAEGDLQAWLQTTEDACKALVGSVKVQPYCVFTDAYEGASPLATLFGEDTADEEAIAKVGAEYEAAKDKSKVHAVDDIVETVKGETAAPEPVVVAALAGHKAVKVQSLRTMRPVSRSTEVKVTGEDAKPTTVFISGTFANQSSPATTPPARPARSPLRALDSNQVTVRSFPVGKHALTTTSSKANFAATYSVAVKFSPSKLRVGNHTKPRMTLNGGEGFPLLI
ncbi:hypothetical protein IAT38_006197 [Cryptococcus sp. DSM 104549]